MLSTAFQFYFVWKGMPAPIANSLSLWYACNLKGRCQNRMDRTRTSFPNNYQQLISGAVAEVDPRQISMSRHLTSAQRFQQAVSMIELAEQVAAYRLRQRRPELSGVEALRIIRSRDANV